jgi:hypothetical protein
MNKNVQFAALMVAASAAMNFDRYDLSGIRINREEWRRRRKSKGGGRGKGMIEGLPHKAAPVPAHLRRAWHA